MKLHLSSLLDCPEDSYLWGPSQTNLFEPQRPLLKESLPCRLFWEFQNTLGCRAVPSPDESSFSDSPGGEGPLRPSGRSILETPRARPTTHALPDRPHPC